MYAIKIICKKTLPAIFFIPLCPQALGRLKCLVPPACGGGGPAYPARRTTSSSTTSSPPATPTTTGRGTSASGTLVTKLNRIYVSVHEVYISRGTSKKKLASNLPIIVIYEKQIFMWIFFPSQVINVETLIISVPLW